MTEVLFRKRGSAAPVPATAHIRSGTVQIDGKALSLKEALPGVPFTGRVYGVLFNFPDALEEAMPILNGPPYKGAPEESVFYFKPDNTLSGFGDPIFLPEGEERARIHGTIGAVIGSFASRLTLHNALEHVWGYTLACDVSLPGNDFYRHPLKQRCRDGFCPVGPWVVPSRAAPDPQDMCFRLLVDGKEAQTGNTAVMSRSFAELLVILTEFMSLFPGDVVLAGSPAGAPLVAAGQTVRIEADGIGMLENPVVAGGGQ